MRCAFSPQWQWRYSLFFIIFWHRSSVLDTCHPLMGSPLLTIILILVSNHTSLSTTLHADCKSAGAARSSPFVSRFLWLPATSCFVSYFWSLFHSLCFLPCMPPLIIIPIPISLFFLGFLLHPNSLSTNLDLLTLPSIKINILKSYSLNLHIHLIILIFFSIRKNSMYFDSSIGKVDANSTQK